MAAGAADLDTHMEELGDQGLAMDHHHHHTAHSPHTPRLRESFHSDSLLAPDTDFMADDRSSAASGLDVADRLTYLEQRMQMQEDEIQLLKLALADVLKRLNISEEHQAAAAAAAAANAAGGGKRAAGAKARPASLALPSRAPPMTSAPASLKKSTTLPSTSSTRNCSPTPPRSSVRSPPSSVKDSPCKTNKSRTSSTASTSKTPQEGKSKEGAVSVGTRRVTHCKVTMQIYLSPLARKTGSSEAAATAAAVPADVAPAPASAAAAATAAAAPGGRRPKAGARTEAKRRTTPTFTLNLQKTSSSTSSSSSQSAQPEGSTYKSPLKSPSQYFQICY